METKKAGKQIILSSKLNENIIKKKNHLIFHIQVVEFLTKESV